MTVSIIIPTLDEAAQIAPVLRALRTHRPHELIVVDGGSQDGTVDLAAEHARVLHAPRGRAAQMNAGAAAASGEVLLFLHADTHLPPDGLQSVRSALRDPSVEAGAFRLTFDESDPWLGLYALCARLDLPSICFGDRGLFVRRTTFETIGGFREMPIFEDLDIVRRLVRLGGFVFLDDEVETSARRFARHGRVRQQVRNVLLWSAYHLGVSPERLARFYGYARR